MPEVPGLIRRHLEIQAGIGAFSHKVIQYHYMNWPDFGVPDSPVPLVDLVNIVRGDLSSLRGVCLVHCSAGVGRTGTMIALNKIIEDIEGGAQVVDIFKTVLDLRSDRVLMVQRAPQYEFIYRCTDHFLGMMNGDQPNVETYYVYSGGQDFENVELQDSAV